MKNRPNHFATDHLLGDLMNRTISSGLVRASAQGGQFLLMLGYNVVMARLLTPRAFGLVGMVMVVIGFLHIFRDMGLTTATIQRADITHAQVSNLFWLNAAISATISVAFAGGARGIAWFYHEPQVMNIALALSPFFILNGLVSQNTALLSRQMRFGTISLIEIGSLITGSLVGIGLALKGQGYWSLVSAVLTQEVLRLVATWSVSRWRPQRPVRGANTRPLIRFGASLTLSGLLYSVSMGFDSLAIGRVCGPFALGLYTRGAALMARPLQQLINPLYTVLVPALSRLHEDPGRYRQFYLQVFESLAIVGFVLIGLFLPLASPITVTILGSQWKDAAAIFAGLSVGAVYTLLSSATSWLYTSQGRGTDMVKLSIFEAVVTIGAIFGGLRYGPAGVAIALSLTGLLIKLPLTFYFAGRMGPVRSSDLSAAFFRQLPILVVTGGTTWLAREQVLQLSPHAQLLVCAPAGLIATLATLSIFPPSRRVSLRSLKTLNEWRERRAS